MMKLSTSAILLGVMALSACATTGTGTTTTTTGTTTAGTSTSVSTSSLITQFWTSGAPSASAIAAMNLDNKETGSVLNAGIGGATFLVGTDTDTAVAYAGVNAGSDVGTTLLAGTATYTAEYEVVQLDNIRIVNGNVTGDTRVENRPIELTADFGAGTVTGTDSQGNLTVAGTLVGSAMGGAVNYRGTNGDLDGEIGNDGVVGAFHGSSSDMVYAGGIVGTKD